MVNLAPIGTHLCSREKKRSSALRDARTLDVSITSPSSSRMQI
jgi:hypothetical protein